MTFPRIADAGLFFTGASERRTEPWMGPVDGIPQAAFCTPSHRLEAVPFIRTIGWPGAVSLSGRR
jgi:hypothetical protein